MCVVMRFCTNDPDNPVSGMSPYKINREHIAFVDSYKDIGITVDRTLKLHSHIKKMINVMNDLTNNCLTCTLCRYSNFPMNHYISHMRSHFEYVSLVWNFGYLSDTRLMERIQKRWTREVSRLSDLSYGERL